MLVNELGRDVVSEPDLKIRHVRLCQCGKLAEHDGICRRRHDDDDRDAERVDLEWEETEARRREDRFEKRKRSLDSARRARRAGLTALELHRHAVERQAALSTVAAGSVQPSRGGDDPIGPPGQQLLDDDPIWREHWRIIRSRLDRVHDKLDEAEGLGATAQQTRLLSVEKDRMVISQGRGLSPAAVVDLLGGDIAGSPETVRRIRRREGFGARDGQPVEESSSGQRHD